MFLSLQLLRLFRKLLQLRFSVKFLKSCVDYKTHSPKQLKYEKQPERKLLQSKSGVIQNLQKTPDLKMTRKDVIETLF